MIVGKPSRDKGARFEREIVRIATAHELQALRVPLSGATKGFKDDVVVKDTTGETWNLEAKKRANGFKQIYEWKGDTDGLVIAADRQPPLIVLNLDDFFDVLKRLGG
jgi:Holliday junction resolvase